MLTPKQIEEIRGHLDKAQNPLFYYDNDCDGLCSFLILRRYLGRGKGVAVRSYPGLDGSYARKAVELNADYVFVLDKPVISKEFLEELEKINLPVVWIDHHAFDGEVNAADFSNLSVYDPARNEGDEKSCEPVTYWAYKISSKKEDLWLAVIGCVADHYLPDFAEEFGERYGEFWSKGIEKPFDAYYGTEIGRIAQSFNFGLKDSTSNIVRMQNFLVSCSGPDEVFLEVTGNYAFRKKNSEIRKRYDAYLEKAKKCVNGDLVFFEYAGDLSISADISNQLSYIFADKYIAVAYKKGLHSNISLRGKGVRTILESILEEFEDATGGGHEDAVGARIKTDDLVRFKEALSKGVVSTKSQ